MSRSSSGTLQNIAASLIEAFTSFIQRLELGEAMSIGETLGVLACLVMRRKNKIARTNLDMVYGRSLSNRKKRRIIRRMWINFGRNIVEFLRLPLYGPDNIGRTVSWTGFEHLDNSNKAGKGALILTAHFGNWELFSILCGIRGMSIAMITKKLKNPFWNDFWMRHRLGSGSHVFPIWKKGAAKGIFRALTKNRLIVYVLDQDTKPSEGAIFVDFFGIKASTTNSLAAISHKRNLPVIPSFIMRIGRTRHHACMLEPMEFENVGTLEESLAHNTRRYLAVLETFVKKYPDHWIWMHRRWKRRPPGEKAIYPSTGK